MTSTFEQLKERRLERMRQGQQTATITSIPSDKEIRVALVPLLEGEYDECIKAAAAAAGALDEPDTLPGAQVADREERRNVVFRSARNIDDYSKYAFPSLQEMMQVLGPHDINHLYDCYIEMAREFSPRMTELSQEDIDFLLDLFVNLSWKDLSGGQVYALSRFLSLLRRDQLTANLPGHLSTP